jgi:sn-glycerol 3-phosphate transport system substrate-binding protein
MTHILTVKIGWKNHRRRQFKEEKMRKAGKKMVSLALCAAMVMSMAACGSKTTNTETTASGTTAATTTTAAQNAAPTSTEAVTEYPDYVTEPITITIWHASASGANGDYMTYAVEKFNAENEYGITVEETYIGSYADVTSKTSTALAANEAPNIVVLGSSGIPMLGEEGVLADMSAYAARDGIDMDNFVSGTTDFCWNNGQLVSIPFNRSSAIFYYNKTIWDSLGLDAPTSLEDLEVKAKTIYEQTGIYGFGMHIDAFFFQEAMVRSLGADGLTAADGKGPGALDNGEFTQLMTDWLSWINEGWCRIPAVTSAGSDMQNALYAGEVASLVASCGSLKNIMKYSEEAGFELGVSLMPVYGGYGSNGGGGNLCIVGATHTQQEIAASWEFIKFLSTDEMVAKRAVDTGYLPVTYSSTETEAIQTLWAETPEFKIAFDQLQYCKDANWSLVQTEWNTYLKQAMSYVIQDFTMTPEEATDYLKQQAEIVFADLK